MRKLLMVASAAAMALTMPALAKEKGGGPGGGKPEKAEKGHGGGHGGGKGGGKGGGPGRGGGGGGFEHGGGGGHARIKADKPQKADRGWARQEIKAEQRSRKQEMKAERSWAKAEGKVEKKFRKNEEKAEREFAKQERKARGEDRRFRGDDLRYSDRDDRFRDRDYRRDGQRLAELEGCPPGLAKKNNGCMPPGLARQSFAVGERLPLDYYSDYALPARYQDWYGDGGEYDYRYDQGNIYQVNSGNNLVSALIPLLGGGLGVGSLLPAGYDVYNLPMQYRDDYVDSADAQYRYGDDAIFQVDPKTQIIQSVVELLAGNLNVGQLLPAGYDTYNLPMEYRDQYVDSDEAMYRYADGNIYEVDPQSRVIEQIVGMVA